MMSCTNSTQKDSKHEVVLELRNNERKETRGANWVHSSDGHDKLMGYQNSTFPLAIYGCMDTASRKLLWLKVWITNSEPQLIGRWYLEHLLETKVISAILKLTRELRPVLWPLYIPSYTDIMEVWIHTILLCMALQLQIRYVTLTNTTHSAN